MFEKWFTTCRTSSIKADLLFPVLKFSAQILCLSVLPLQKCCSTLGYKGQLFLASASNGMDFCLFTAPVRPRLHKSSGDGVCVFHFHVIICPIILVSSIILLSIDQYLIYASIKIFNDGYNPERPFSHGMSGALAKEWCKCAVRKFLGNFASWRERPTCLLPVSPATGQRHPDTEDAIQPVFPWAACIGSTLLFLVQEPLLA